MPKGKKQCTACQQENGARAVVCIKCKQLFTHATKKEHPTKVAPKKIRRKKKNKPEKVDWRSLQKGDIIKVKQGSGPYWPPNEGGDKDKISLGYVGKFKVHALDKEGIIAWGNKSEGGDLNRCYIYMGSDKHTSYGLYKTAHKILLLKRVNNVE